MEENKNENRIEEEIRQFKLYKIQHVEAKIREYNDTYNVIKENIVIRFTKNASSSILRLVLVLITLSLVLLGMMFLFPEVIIEILRGNGETFSDQDRMDLMVIGPYIGWFFMLIAFLFGIVAWLLKKNIKKRNTIYKLANLVEEVIEYMDENVKEDKKKYEYFVDSIAEIENKKNSKD